MCRRPMAAARTGRGEAHGHVALGRDTSMNANTSGTRLMTAITYPCFIARPDGRGRWYWTYYVREDEPIAYSKEKYVDRRDCEESVRRVQESLSRPVFFLGL